MYRTIESKIDKSVNFIFEEEPGSFLEARYVRRTPEKLSIYLSSQTGCRQACRFCGLTQSAQTSDRSAKLSDYFKQSYEVFEKYRKEIPIEGKATRVNFNFMARGEPLENNSVRQHFTYVRDILLAQASHYELDASINISTIIPESFSRVPLEAAINEPANIYYSVWGSKPKFRNKWLPKALDIDKALEKIYMWERQKLGKVVLHMGFISGENDSEEDVIDLCNHVREVGLNPRFNIIRYNALSGTGIESSDATIERNIQIIESMFSNKGHKIISRIGSDVAASCGLFVDKKGNI